MARRPIARRAAGAAVIALLGLVAAALAWHAWRDPRIVLLVPDSGASWVRVDRPFDLGAHLNTPTHASFVVQASLPPRLGPTTVRVAALGRAVVWLDDRRLSDETDGDWRRTDVVAVPADVPAGRHTLRVEVTNANGPSLVRVNSVGLGVRSGQGEWLAVVDGQQHAAVPVGQSWEPELPPQFGPTWRDLVRWSPLLASLFVVSTWLLLWRRPARLTSAERGRWVRWAVLAAWGVLAVNNLTRVTLGYGYDVESHEQYIAHVAAHGSLPRADQGWQFFQAPLYYVVAAAVERAAALFGASAATLRFVPRAITLASGLALVELSYRAARWTHPSRGDLHAVAAAVGGLLPVNLYMAQAASNEPMAAVASAGLFVVALRLVAEPARARSTRHLLGVGLLLGVAVLTKVSTLLWTLPLAMAIGVALQRAGGSWRDAVRAAVVVPAAALGVSGWWFARNLLTIGRPFYPESSLQRARWWQDPGFRTPDMFYTFGHVFDRSVYNGTHSVWDSLYGTLWANGIPSGRPPWNYGLMACGLWLGLVPTAAILAGAARCWGRSGGGYDPVGPRLATVTVAGYVGAILYVFLTLPIYSCAKASYLLGTAPCLAVLAAAGVDLLRPYRWPRALVGGAIVCWAAVAYLTYFVVN